jgi:uncharacterized protein YbaP (TraB family)
MFRVLLILCWLAASALPAAALCTGPSLLSRLSPADRATLDATVAATPFGSGTIWTAQKGDTTLTVVGTMHLYDPRLDAMLARVADRVKTADLLLVEMTPDEETRLQQSIMARPEVMMITSGPTLIDVLDEQTWGQLAAAASARQIPPIMAAKFQPWYLMLVLSMPPCAMADVMAGQRGLDHMIMDTATAAGVPMQAVEPWDTLFGLFMNDSFEEQVEMLRLSLLDPGVQEEMFVAMLEGYAEGNIAQVWELSRLSAGYVPGMDKAEADALFKETEQLLLIDRNKAWIPVIEQASAGKSNVIVAVGAAHLSGESGILWLLQNDGWTIAPLP